MIDEYENDDLDEEEYYQQLADDEWYDYVEVCIDCGCLECGHEITTGSELNDYNSCVYCEGEL